MAEATTGIKSLEFINLHQSPRFKRKHTLIGSLFSELTISHDTSM
jgi:hypothetical protein